MKTADIRSTFLEFFRQRQHTEVPSAPLVPANDPTLMFTNSGMVPFKHIFLGSEKAKYPRVVDVQRCLRAGGKHNDLDQVGYTARHHTFFEMMGNWSFGDYFKREAIQWSWELLTEVFKLPKDKLWVTVYHTDDEAFDIWHDEIGVPAERIIRIGDKGAAYDSDNFWQMADTGPCGPSSEIFYDHGPHIPGGPPGSPDEDGDRYIEIWNLVFMQFDRQTDGELKPLPAPCVDTGMGLERLAAVLQGVNSNYDIDLFVHLIDAAAKLTGCADTSSKSLRVIADHIRACSFLIVDNVLPSNEGRGYVLRRIIRRALRHGWMLGVRGEFFWHMVAPLVAQMGEAYPELARMQARVESILKREEQRFGETLEHGMQVFDEIAARSEKIIAGDDAFRLYDTYGFPVDLTADVARERGMEVDMAGFDKAMEAQRERARAAGHFQAQDFLPAALASRLDATEFLGYEHVQADACKIVGIIKQGASVDALQHGDEAVIILDRTPFYAESGGQVGDTGTLELDTDTAAYAVNDTRKLGGVLFGHFGTWQGSGELAVGDVVKARVDAARRQAIVLNHSATHLLHAALRRVLGDHITQKGSLVAPDRLRFDFSHHHPVTPAQLLEVQTLVNTEIRRNEVAQVRHMSYDEAMETGAMALFGEKYGDVVRVLAMGDFSVELCGGTHVSRTGDIGLLQITSESGVAAGIRRIEAITGEAALQHVQQQTERLHAVNHLLAASGADTLKKLEQLLARQKQLEQELDQLKAKAAGQTVNHLISRAVVVDDIQVLATRVEGLDAKGLRAGVDEIKRQLQHAVIVLAAGKGDKASLVVGVTGKGLQHIKAGAVMKHIASHINGKGGGRPDMAQGGGENTPALDHVLRELPAWLQANMQ